MALFITLANFTDQGIKNVKDSPDRLQAFKSSAEKLGLKVKDAYYCVGAHDIVLISEGTVEALTAALLKTATLGNVRTQTLRAFTPEEFKKILGTI